AIEVGSLASRVVALKACLVMGIVDGQISPEEWKVLSEFRAALAIDEAQLHSFHELVHRHRQLTMHEYQRRLAAPQLGTLYASEGWQGVMQFFPADVLAAAASGPTASPSTPSTLSIPSSHGAARENAEVSQRYRQLGSLDEGTLGRELWRYYKEREFELASDPGTVPDALVEHDIMHIISGYDSSLEGELQTLAFVAGMRQEDPFSALFLVLLQYTAGRKVAPGGQLAGARVLFDHDKILRALDRGRGTAVDFSAKHDFWDIMDQPIAALRERFGVPAVA
ncbi:MAG TPA: hypothetical protein VGB85_28625, partial [Nannocystis sp.]